MHQSFEGKVALVTGGSRGIGLVPLGLGCRPHWDHNDGKSSFSVGWSKRASPREPQIFCCQRGLFTFRLVSQYTFWTPLQPHSRDISDETGSEKPAELSSSAGGLCC